jgi:C4-dicarboxylate-specific signal transduction histidine kinase
MHTNRRLRLAVIGAVFLLLLAQVIATGQLLERSQEAAVAAAEDKTERISRAVESSINRNFVQVDAMLAGLPAILATFVRDGRLDAAGAGRVLRELNNQNFTFRDVLLVGADGMPVATSLPVSRRRPLPVPLGPAFIAGRCATPRPGNGRCSSPALSYSPASAR